MNVSGRLSYTVTNVYFGNTLYLIAYSFLGAAVQWSFLLPRNLVGWIISSSEYDVLFNPVDYTFVV